MITNSTPIGTRVFRHFDGQPGTIVKITEYRPDDLEDVGSVSVCLDRDLTVWSGTYEAWDLADGDLDEVDQSEQVFTLIRQALVAKHDAGYEQARYVHKHTEPDDVARRRLDKAQQHADDLVVRMWRTLYDWNSR